MTRNRHTAGHAPKRPAGQPNALSERERSQAERRHLLRALMQTAVVTAVLGGIFELTSSHTLHAMAPFLFAWSGGWALASLSIRITRIAKRDRSKSDDTQ